MSVGHIDWNAVHRRLDATKDEIERGFSPGPEERKRILRARADLLARQSEAPRQGEIIETVEFAIAGERYGIESGSARILERTAKGFTIADATRVVSEAVKRFPRVDTFFIWGFPFETMEDFHKTVFQMIAFRLIGARILPSLLCWLPQTDLYREYKDKARFSFYPHLLPEYMLTGHEICDDGHLSVSERHAHLFDFIQRHPDIFTGFFQPDVETNVLPKYAVLKKHGFYYSGTSHVKETDSCGACSPRVAG